MLYYTSPLAKLLDKVSLPLYLFISLTLPWDILDLIFLLSQTVPWGNMYPTLSHTPNSSLTGKPETPWTYRRTSAGKHILEKTLYVIFTAYMTGSVWGASNCCCCVNSLLTHSPVQGTSGSRGQPQATSSAWTLRICPWVPGHPGSCGCRAG